jgi:2-(1,2-epoxy-1,2-dihydrophenyl)acetyl-CoA isomerase
MRTSLRHPHRTGQAMSIDLTIDDQHTAQLRLNAPERLNALTADDWTALRDALQQAADVPGIRGLVLSGTGKAFCAGADLRFLADLNAMPEPARRAALRVGSELIRELIRFPVPTVALVDGTCVGVGASLALGCDTIVTTVRSFFGFVFTGLGIPAGDMATPWLLARRVGSRQAARVLINSQTIGAEQAQAIALVDRVVDDKDAAMAAIEWSRSPIGAVRTTKRQVLELEGAFEELDAQLEVQLAELSAAVGGADFAEGLASIHERRQPRFDH